MRKDLTPDFLVIGAGKSGTTTVNNYLKQHHQIFVPSKKEPNFFGYELTAEADLQGKRILHHYKESVTSLSAYEDLFRPARSNQIKGETSNTYLYHQDAPARIFFHAPNVKLIAILRNPVDRLYSRYMHLVREQRQPTNQFSDCLDRSTIWWERNDLIQEGFYYKHLKRFYDLFDVGQLRIYLYEDLRDNPANLMQNIYQFLGADPMFRPDFNVELNKSGYIRNRAVNKVIGQNGFIKNTLEQILPRKIYAAAKDATWAQKYLSKLRNTNLVKPPLSAHLRQQITQEIYQQDIMLLSKLINRDLRTWTNYEP